MKERFDLHATVIDPALVDDQWRKIHAILSLLPWDGLALRLNSPNLVCAEGVWYHLAILRFELGLDRANR